MADPVSITRNGHRTLFKWHRARRHDADTVFTTSRIREGMELGASIEVDLVLHADRGFALLHDLDLGRESTGQGRVVDTSAAELRRERRRDNAGVATDAMVGLLEDLAPLLSVIAIHPDALLQLDYKEDAAALDPAAIQNFAASVAPFAGHMILSSGDAAAVKLLTDAAPGIRIGYDPCHDGALERLAVSRDFAGFVRDAVAASPKAEMIYLHHEMVLHVSDAGFDMVAAFHAAGRRVDAYTIQRVDAVTLPKVERLLSLRVDQITTDDPEGLAAALEARG